MIKYAVVIEQGPTGYSAYVPDLLGRVAVSSTREGVQVLIREAIPFTSKGFNEMVTRCLSQQQVSSTLMRS